MEERRMHSPNALSLHVVNLGEIFDSTAVVARFATQPIRECRRLRSLTPRVDERGRLRHSRVKYWVSVLYACQACAEPAGPRQLQANQHGSYHATFAFSKPAKHAPSPQALASFRQKRNATARVDFPSPLHSAVLATQLALSPRSISVSCRL